MPSIRCLKMGLVDHKNAKDLLLQLVQKCPGLQELNLVRPDDTFIMDVLRTCRSLQVLETATDLGFTTYEVMITIMEEVAAFKKQTYRGEPENRLRLESLVLTDAGCSMTMTLSELGVTQVSLKRWDGRGSKPFIEHFGWAMNNLDLTNFLEDHERFQCYQKWDRLIRHHGGSSALQSLRFNGFVVSLEDRTFLSSVIEKSPSLENLQIVFKSTGLTSMYSDQWARSPEPTDPLYWTLDHLGSRITKLELLGFDEVITTMDFLSRNADWKLSKLVHLRINLDGDKERSDHIGPRPWQAFFTALNFSVFKILVIETPYSDACWKALLSRLPQNGLLEGNGFPVSLESVEFKFTVMISSSDIWTLQEQLSKQAPNARLIAKMRE